VFKAIEDPAVQLADSAPQQAYDEGSDADDDDSAGSDTDGGVSVAERSSRAASRILAAHARAHPDEAEALAEAEGGASSDVEVVGVEAANDALEALYVEAEPVDTSDQCDPVNMDEIIEAAEAEAKAVNERYAEVVLERRKEAEKAMEVERRMGVVAPPIAVDEMVEEELIVLPPHQRCGVHSLNLVATTDCHNALSLMSGQAKTAKITLRSALAVLQAFWNLYTRSTSVSILPILSLSCCACALLTITAERCPCVQCLFLLYD
jgi:hypothetical protein